MSMTFWTCSHCSEGFFPDQVDQTPWAWKCPNCDHNNSKPGPPEYQLPPDSGFDDPSKNYAGDFKWTPNLVNEKKLIFQQITQANWDYITHRMTDGLSRGIHVHRGLVKNQWGNHDLQEAQ